MKLLSTLSLLCLALFSQAQTLPIDFESAVTTSNFVDFDGGVATVIANPQSSGTNTSGKVAQIVRNGGQVWAGSKIILAANLDLSVMNTISMQVYTTAPIGTDVKLKLESATGSVERDVLTTVTGAWETLVFDYTGQTSLYSTIAFMFDFGNVGNGSATSTFLFDNITQYSSGTHIDLPVTFDDAGVNYRVTDFGGNSSELVVDPTNTNNHVIKTTKTTAAATWAGTTIGTPAGFKTDIPLTLTESKMTMKVWSPDAGIPVRLKVEDSGDPTHTCETQTLTTKTAEWEDVIFDFATEAPGTAALSFGLANGWTYNMASVFFNFGTDGTTAGEKTYYFDNYTFGDTPLPVLSVYTLGQDDIDIYPNPSRGTLHVNSAHQNISSVKIYSLTGALISETSQNTQSYQISTENLSPGYYNLVIETEDKMGSFQLIKI